MPCPGPFHFSHSVHYIYDVCPLPDSDVGPSIFVCDVEHTSFHFGLCGHKFVLCFWSVSHHNVYPSQSLLEHNISDHTHIYVY